MSTVISESDAKQNIAANIQRLLIDRQWSQGELARRTGEPIMMISRLCRGQHMPNVLSLARVAEAFDVSVDRLISSPPEKISAKSA